MRHTESAETGWQPTLAKITHGVALAASPLILLVWSSLVRHRRDSSSSSALPKACPGNWNKALLGNAVLGVATLAIVDTVHNDIVSADWATLILYVVVWHWASRFPLRRETGVLVGVAIVLVAYMLVSISPLRSGEAIVFGGLILIHENAWAARGVVLVAISAFLTKSIPTILSLSGLALVLTVATGSRTASLALGAQVVVLLACSAWDVRKVRGIAFSTIVLLNIVLLSLATRDASLGSVAPDPRNLLIASESLSGSVWTHEGVSVSVTEDGAFGSTAITVARTVSRYDARPTLKVPLRKGIAYVLSFYVRGDSESAGWRMWAPRRESSSEWSWNIRLVDSVVLTNAPGEIELSTTVVEPVGDWRHLFAVFTYRGEDGGTFMGPVPSFIEGEGRSAAFSQMQLRELNGDWDLSVHDYQPTYAPKDSWVTGVSRLQTVRIAFEGFLASPWVGVGHAAFALSDLQNPSVHSHAHNLLAQTLHDRGVVGLFGLSLVLVPVFYRASRTVGGLTIVVGLLVLNLFDLTLWNGAAMLPALVALGSIKDPSLIDNCGSRLE